jgi:alkylhydroperoxidase family enzyme
MLRNSIVFTFCVLFLFAGGDMLRAHELPSRPRFDAADQTRAWQRIPQERPSLPVWACVLVDPLPKATAALLELDYLHRVRNPLGPVLAGKLRWAAADSIGCEYARRYGEADLRRAGVGDEELRQLAGDGSALSEADRAALAFARQLTLAGHEVSDEQMAGLVEQFGPETVVGIVHTVAFANFQNRLFLALGVDIEPDGPLSPVEFTVDRKQQDDVSVPPRRPWDELQSVTANSNRPARVDWGQRDFSTLEQALDRQKNRSPRIRLPDSERLAGLPPDVRKRMEKIVWSNISMGYQPQLTGGWFRLMDAFRNEAQLDRIFANSVFWVVTRSNECFY